MTLPGQIGHQGPPRANDLARRVRNLERQLMMIGGQVAQVQSLANTSIGNIRCEGFSQHITMASDDTWHTVATATYSPPAGMSSYNAFAWAYFQFQAATGTTPYLGQCRMALNTDTGLIADSSADTISGTQSIASVGNSGAGAGSLTVAAQAFPFDSRAASMVWCYLNVITFWQP